MTSQRPLRLCVIAPITRRHRGYFPPHSILVAKILTDLGHDVVVLTGDLPEGGGAILHEDGSEVHYLTGTPPSKGGEVFWRSTAAAFDRLHADRPFDIVLGRGASTWGFFRFSRFSAAVPVVLHEGTYPRWLHQIEIRFGRLAPVLSFILAPVFALKNRKTYTCMQAAARVVCITPALAAAVNRASWWRPPQSLSLTYGFDASRYHPSPPALQAPPRLVSLGRLTWDKGILRMIDVLARLKNRTAVLEAMGPASPKVQSAIMNRALKQGVADRYSAPGAVQHEDVPHRLSGATAFLFPSTHAEGLGKVVLEAMAAGLPVVAYRLPVLEDIVEDGVTGFLVPIRSVIAMADRIDQLLADPELAKRMGLAARQRIDTEFRTDAINAKWRALLAELVDEAAARQGG